jgi:hypothetical protein
LRNHHLAYFFAAHNHLADCSCGCSITRQTWPAAILVKYIHGFDLTSVFSVAGIWHEPCKQSFLTGVRRDGAERSNDGPKQQRRCPGGKVSPPSGCGFFVGYGQGPQTKG